MKYPPVFIIGAGRSGTNILRDTITYFDGFTTWPCDEINLIFRHGNRTMPHDEFGAQHASDYVKKYIHGAFDKFNATDSSAMVVEKTCANSLRVPFLYSVFPNAKFIFIIRDGYDVTSSAMKRWTASIELKYLLKKLPYVPIADVPYYAWEFLINRMKQMLNREKRQNSWGPRYEGMEKDVKRLFLDEVCAIQWSRSAEKAFEDLLQIPKEQRFFMTYEVLTNSPVEAVTELIEWLGIEASNHDIISASNNIRKSKRGRGKQDIKSSMALETIDATMKNIYEKVSSNNQKII